MQVQLSNVTVELKDRLGFGDGELIQAEMMSALRVSAEMRRQVDDAAAKADAAGKPMGADPFNLTGLAMDGKAILAARIKAAELSILKITKDNGQVIPFSSEWLYNLDQTDGRKLMAEVDKLRRQVDSPAEIQKDVEGK